MAKTIHDTTSVKEGPSPFGSHTSMISAEETAKLINKEKYAVLKDEIGFYVTEKKNIDSHVTDPYRIASEDWREKHLEKALENAL